VNDSPPSPPAPADPAPTRDPFRRPVRATADGEARIRPLELPGEVVEETDALRFPLLALALLSMVLVIMLAREPAVAPLPVGVSAGISDIERRHLPELVMVPAGRLPVQAEAPAGPELAPFRISRTEVTVEQFRIFVRHTGYTNPAWADFPCFGSTQNLSWEHPGYEQADTYPVVCVSARDAMAFAAWLSEQTGQALRLPTELEWEYAARGGSRSLFWWGEAYDPDYADCGGCGARAPQHPAYVGTRPANAYGLLDVAGNVREWTCSPFAAIGAAGPVSQCAGGYDEAVNLVVRGGSWQEPQQALQLGYRGPFGAWHRNVWTGFRVAAAVD